MKKAGAKKPLPFFCMKPMKLNTTLFELGVLDRLAEQNTPLHRLDPRAKLITTLGFIFTVVSFNRYEISALLPLTIYPVFLIGAGDLPGRYLFKKILIASPFALFVGVFNPFFDRAPMVMLHGVAISAGWISFASVVLRFVLTVSAALALIGITGFNAICMALSRIGVPRAFIIQLLFLYRYLFVLTDEGLRMVRARSLRSFKGRGTGLKIYANMLGQLLLRTMDRAQRIHRSMLCRGFDGEIRLNREFSFTIHDLVFCLFWLSFFGLARSFNLSLLLGQLASRMTA